MRRQLFSTGGLLAQQAASRQVDWQTTAIKQGQGQRTPDVREHTLQGVSPPGR